MARTKTVPFAVLWVVATALFLAASEAQMAVPSTGQLCISDCSTCPVICTAPPPPSSYSTYIPPPPSLESYGGYMAAPVMTRPPPPPEFYGGYMASPEMTRPPPPVSKYFMGAQPSGQMPQTVGPRDYSYPYYYFYSSNSCSSSFVSTFVVSLVCFFHFVF